jgi:c-di-GMP-binding flagellar brake protein YcgR
MQEQRQFVRLDTRLEIQYTVLPAADGRGSLTKDVSAGGICFFSERVLAPATRLQVTMRVPGREQPIRFSAEVVWSERYEIIGRARREEAVEIGAQFLEIAPADRDAIMQHVILNLRMPRPSDA